VRRCRSLRIHDGDGGQVHYFFDGRRALHYMLRAAHPHQDRADQFASSSFAANLQAMFAEARSGKMSTLAPPFNDAGIQFLDQIGIQGFVGHAGRIVSGKCLCGSRTKSPIALISNDLYLDSSYDHRPGRNRIERVQ
jgi:hypothetical protein